jgi:2-polyprenyl-6-methoxyphenol hydroxylase-like FAD-dependent oxidoreductase
MQRTYDVIVVGAGLSGGLPCAAYLQKAGLEALLLEANSEFADGPADLERVRGPRPGSLVVAYRASCSNSRVRRLMSRLRSAGDSGASSFS